MKPMTDWMDIAQYFYMTDEQLGLFSKRFTAALEDALQGKPSSLLTVPSFLGMPTGCETGTYLALDFGGTNVRVSRIRLLGNRCFLIDKQVSRPLYEMGAKSRTAAITGEMLFDAVADLIGAAAGGNREYVLGHTFSFGVEQESMKDGRLVGWSKEMTVQGLEGQYVNACLAEALARRGLEKIRPAVLLNDTTAALLASAYQYTPSYTGVICGTGFNICYYEPMRQMVLILEAGNFDRMYRSKWDEAVDANSRKPGYHKLEKMVSGAYISEIYRQAIMTYFRTDDIPPFTTEDMNRVVATENDAEGRLLMSRLWQRIVLPDDVSPLRNIGAAVFVRAAQLSGAAVYGVLRHLYPQGQMPPQTVAVEGSVIEHVRGAIFMAEDALRACQTSYGQSRSRNIPAELRLVQNGPSVGAAIAAAMADKNEL